MENAEQTPAFSGAKTYWHVLWPTGMLRRNLKMTSSHPYNNSYNRVLCFKTTKQCQAKHQAPIRKIQNHFSTDSRAHHFRRVSCSESCANTLCNLNKQHPCLHHFLQAAQRPPPQGEACQPCSLPASRHSLSGDWPNTPLVPHDLHAQATPTC